MPDGSAFVFDAKKRADSNGARELPAKQALIAEPIETASNEKIPQPTEKSNTKAQKSDRDIDDAYVEYNRRALVSEETLKQWLRDYAADNPKLYYYCFCIFAVIYSFRKQFLWRTLLLFAPKQYSTAME